MRTGKLSMVLVLCVLCVGVRAQSETSPSSEAVREHSNEIVKAVYTRLLVDNGARWNLVGILRACDKKAIAKLVLDAGTATDVAVWDELEKRIFAGDEDFAAIGDEIKKEIPHFLSLAELFRNAYTLGFENAMKAIESVDEDLFSDYCTAALSESNNALTSDSQTDSQ